MNILYNEYKPFTQIYAIFIQRMRIADSNGSVDKSVVISYLSRNRLLFFLKIVLPEVLNTLK